MSVIPDSHRDLLERPLYTHLATVRPDGTPQVNPMWFTWDGEHVRFTSTTRRQKHRNVALRPEIALSVNDPEQPTRYLEVRGVVERVEDDSEGRFFLEVAARYGFRFDGPPADARHRVVYVVKPKSVSTQ
ncbi:PPOX class F420-dependent oxidoreductase [Saccharothrix sp. 6-C]|uniref:PPOX class F420-dependent oxidoreductase n=1 Tax=Saccharothrix sp. 6-C TaxID=2781735 RepID=UPI0019172D99|nr:PPOX class F420-dependent oxidoreductase [Saccharothrix sp. 6-C]QQQ78269.1 PPOX class F420-dependent oxidoreductase [Saccharothrix sp. 6-C]